MKNLISKGQRTFQPAAWFLIAATIALPSLALTGCEQVNQLAAREAEELEQNTEHQQQILAPLAGRYEGTLTNVNRNGGEPQQVRLVLVPMLITVQNPGRNDITPYPTLGGTLSVVEKSRVPGEDDSVIPIAHYSMAKFNNDSGNLRLTGTYTSNSAGPIAVALEGVYQFGRLSGKASSSLIGELGNLELQQVARSQ